MWKVVITDPEQAAMSKSGRRSIQDLPSDC